MSANTLFERIKFARQGMSVERAHTDPHLLRYSVGVHTADLIALIIFTWKETYGRLPSAELLTAATFHDVPECVTGDIPSPAKMAMGDAFQKTEDQILWGLGVKVSLTQEEQEWLDVADKVELVLWAKEEAARGNSFFLGWDYADYFNKNPPPPVFAGVLANAHRHGGRRFYTAELKSMVGL